MKLQRTLLSILGVVSALVGSSLPSHAKLPPLEDPVARNHWSFKAPVRPPLPAVKNKKWVRNPIDQFVLARLEKEHYVPSPEADLH